MSGPALRASLTQVIVPAVFWIPGRGVSGIPRPNHRNTSVGDHPRAIPATLLAPRTEQSDAIYRPARQVIDQNAKRKLPTSRGSFPSPHPARSFGRRHELPACRQTGSWPPALLALPFPNALLPLTQWLNGFLIWKTMPHGCRLSWRLGFCSTPGSLLNLTAALPTSRDFCVSVGNIGALAPNFVTLQPGTNQSHWAPF